MSKAKKYVVEISKATITKHVKIAKALANKRKGKLKGILPSYSWLNANGYFRTYEVLRSVNFRGIKRATA